MAKSTEKPAAKKAKASNGGKSTEKKASAPKTTKPAKDVVNTGGTKPKKFDSQEAAEQHLLANGFSVDLERNSIKSPCYKSEKQRAVVQDHNSGVLVTFSNI